MYCPGKALADWVACRRADLTQFGFFTKPSEGNQAVALVGWSLVAM